MAKKTPAQAPADKNRLTAKTEKTVKTITRTFAVMDRAYTYNYYTKNTIRKGTQFRIGGPHGYRLLDDGLLLVLGHGADELVPRDRFHLEIEEEQQVLVTTTTRRHA